jgi:hypothetical protein
MIVKISFHSEGVIMRSEVRVKFDDLHEFQWIEVENSDFSSEEARSWLDKEFSRLGCEPIRPVGKVLIADKVLCVAMASGVDGLQDLEWGKLFAQAVAAALGRPVIRVDVQAMTVGY